MSVEAMTWALNLAPVPMDPAGARRSAQPNSACAFVLVGLANHAGPDGKDAFPGVETLMRYTRLSERTVRTALDRLEVDGTIKPCDPEVLAAKIKRADRRPNGYDLCMEKVRVDLTVDEMRDIAKSNPFLRPLIEQAIHARGATTAPRGPEDGERGATVAPRGEERGATVAERGATASERGAGVAPEPSLTIQEPSDEKTAAGAARPDLKVVSGTDAAEPTIEQRAERVLRTWWDWLKVNDSTRLPTQTYISIKKIVVPALAAGRPERLVEAGLNVLVAERRAISQGTLATAMTQAARHPNAPEEFKPYADGEPAAGNGRRRAPAYSNETTWGGDDPTGGWGPAAAAAQAALLGDE